MVENSRLRFRQHIVLLSLSGMSSAEISRRPDVKVSQSTVRYWCSKYKAQGMIGLHGKLEGLSEADKSLLETVKANPRMPIRNILKTLIPNYPRSYNTACKRVRQNGLRQRHGRRHGELQRRNIQLTSMPQFGNTKDGPEPHKPAHQPAGSQFRKLISSLTEALTMSLRILT